MSVLSVGLKAHTIQRTAFGPYDPYCMFLRAVLGQQVRRARAGDVAALCWFASHDSAIGSFHWYCLSLGLKEMAIRRKVSDYAARTQARRRVSRLLKEIGKVRT